MAIITRPTTTSFNITETAPQGTYVATCLAATDQLGVERPNFDNPLEKERRDVTRILFGIKGSDGKLYRTQTFEFLISGSPKSNLVKFLTAWGSFGYGVDYCERIGDGALITNSHKPSADGTRTFANIINIAPVPEARRSEILSVDAFKTFQQ
jgi:hypothetical protein